MGKINVNKTYWFKALQLGIRTDIRAYNRLRLQGFQLLKPIILHFWVC